MKEINMYVRGAITKEGSFSCVILEYKGNRKIKIYKNDPMSANRSILLGFLNGIAKIKEPCLINAYSHCHIGIKGKIKGADIDLKDKLINLITERGHTFNFNVSTDEQDYMINLIRKCKNYNQKIIHLKG